MTDELIFGLTVAYIMVAVCLGAGFCICMDRYAHHKWPDITVPKGCE